LIIQGVKAVKAMKPGRIAALTVTLTAIDMVRKISLKETPSMSQLFFFALGYLLLSIYLAWIQGEMRLSFPGLASVLWLNLFMVGSFSNMVEGFFFTSVFESGSEFMMGALVMLFFSGVQAGLASIILEGGEKRLKECLREYFAETSAMSWLKRVAIGALSYFPIYFFFGMLVSPFVMPYYSDPSLGLIVPPFTLIIPVEILRGFLYVAALLPIAASLGGTTASDNPVSPRRDIRRLCGLRLRVSPDPNEEELIGKTPSTVLEVLGIIVGLCVSVTHT